MLSVVARDEVHLQFRFREETDHTSHFAVLGKLWESEITGISDPTLNRHHQLTGGTANVVVGFRPEYWRGVFAEDVPDNLYSFNEDLVGIKWNGRTGHAARSLGMDHPVQRGNPV